MWCPGESHVSFSRVVCHVSCVSHLSRVQALLQPGLPPAGRPQPRPGGPDQDQGGEAELDLHLGPGHLRGRPHQ